MEPESSSPYPQVPAIRPYPERTPSSPHDPLHIENYSTSKSLKLSPEKTQILSTNALVAN
jgi:hypothetical protein